MKIAKVLAFITLLFMTASCGTVSKNRSYSFDQVRLELGMNDLQYMGEQEISIEYTSYLGLFKSIQKVNGQLYDPINRKELTMPRSCHFRNRNLDKAAYKLIETFPDAVYFQIVMETKDVDKLFLGGIHKETARVKAYKLK